VTVNRNKGKGKARSTGHTPDGTDPDELVGDVAHRLQIACDDIISLHTHPAVVKLLEKKKIRLEEWSELCVLCLTLVLLSPHLRFYGGGIAIFIVPY
jgi:hypothetical protein